MDPPFPKSPHDFLGQQRAFITMSEISFMSSDQLIFRTKPEPVLHIVATTGDRVGVVLIVVERGSEGVCLCQGRHPTDLTFLLPSPSHFPLYTP